MFANALAESFDQMGAKLGGWPSVGNKSLSSLMKKPATVLKIQKAKPYAEAG
jgi:hypothetical protein